jgi:glutathione S-transferase
MRALDVFTSYSVSVARLGVGMYVGPLGARPEKTLELYEFEACPYCRKVREALTFLDLDAIIFPCPKNGTRFRPRVKERGGKTQFPYLVDPNTGREMYESDDIIAYLYQHYGSTKPPLYLRLGPMTSAASSVASLMRFGRGHTAKKARVPEKMLELYSFEASPFCRIARDALCELELPYLLHNVAKRSPKRKEFIARSGRMMVPYLVDPNTGREMFESAEIAAYLFQTYAE